ncbi:Long-chain-fatty-acid--CoA ligase [Achlya hypogyna]|uniref:Long-chain-fatty-acid--CoA ligase n=1 Tax=Achlya hypogyna TaxID=1202772 RepID=A0A1V9YR63_ACHHY|nr:Long-chain-fatty-acid--CoA ligase [Achlya hypogyna]
MSSGPIHRVDYSSTFERQTILELLQRSVAKFPDRRFLGHRPLDANGVAGAYEWQTYRHVYERIERLGHRFLGIYMKNCPAWVLAQYAATYSSATIVPLYDTLGRSASAFILNQTMVATVLCSVNEAKALLAMAASTPHLRHIVICDADSIDEVLTMAAAAAEIQVETLAGIEMAGAATMQPPEEVPTTTAAVLMYTSGTTGDPKGAMLTHNNLMSLSDGITDRIANSKAADAYAAGLVILSYLPLAHIAEFQFQLYATLYGGAIGFYQGSPLKILEDLQALRPTVFLSVPRILNRIYDKVMESIRATGGIKSWLFLTALNTKIANLETGQTSHVVYDALVFSKLKTQLGLDRVAWLASGAAPLAPHVMSFFRAVLGCPCTEGYGQTETSSIVTLSMSDDMDAGSVGRPVANIEMKLVSVPDMGYNVTDTMHGDGDHAIPVRGRGEVCIRGPTVFSGYFKEPEKTAEVIDADGWLHSGDIGVWTTDGRLKIVDRKKNIFKLSQGEYVAPEKIENVIQGSSYVAQSFVHGDSLHSTLVAVVVPEEAAVAKLATSLQVPGALADWCQDRKVVQAVLDDVRAVSQARGLIGVETVRALHLTPMPFSLANGLLTPTFKLKRHDAKKVFAQEIDSLYEATGDVVPGAAGFVFAQ